MGHPSCSCSTKMYKPVLLLTCLLALAYAVEKRQAADKSALLLGAALTDGVDKNNHIKKKYNPVVPMLNMYVKPEPPTAPVKPFLDPFMMGMMGFYPFFPLYGFYPFMGFNWFW